MARCCRPERVRTLLQGSVTMLPGFAEGQWWVQDAAAALPARLFGDIKGKSIADLCAAPGGKTAQLAHAGARVTAVDRSPARMARLRDNLARLSLQAETVVADAAEWAGRGRRLRRHPGRCALHLDRHHPPPSRRRLAAAGSRHRRADGAAEAPAAKGGRAAQAGRHAGLLHLFAGTGGGRSRRSRRCWPQSRPAPGADRAGRGRGPCRDRHRRRRFAHPALPSAACRPARLAGWTDFTPPGWLNPDFAPDFPTPALIRAVSRWCRGRVSGLKGFVGRSPPHQGKACRSLNADVSRR